MRGKESLCKQTGAGLGLTASDLDKELHAHLAQQMKMLQGETLPQPGPTPARRQPVVLTAPGPACSFRA